MESKTGVNMGKRGSLFFSFLFFVTLGQGSNRSLFPEWGSDEGEKNGRCKGRRYREREGTEEGITYGYSM